MGPGSKIGKWVKSWWTEWIVWQVMGKFIKFSLPGLMRTHTCVCMLNINIGKKRKCAYLRDIIWRECQDDEQKELNDLKDDSNKRPVLQSTLWGLPRREREVLILLYCVQSDSWECTRCSRNWTGAGSVGVSTIIIGWKSQIWERRQRTCGFFKPLQKETEVLENVVAISAYVIGVRTQGHSRKNNEF